MLRTVCSLTLLALLVAAAPAGAQQWVFGGFCSTCGSATDTNRLYDDGLHDDGAAGDGVFGAIITVDAPAGSYPWLVDSRVEHWMGTSIPFCWCSSPPSYAALWTSGPGDVIHFRVGGSPPGTGWQGVALACDHGTPAGAQLEVAILAGMGPWSMAPGYAAERHGSVWERVVTVPTAGAHQFCFRDPVNHVAFTAVYNAVCPCIGFEQPVVGFNTTVPNSDVRFQFDERSGRMRAVELGPTPATRTSWGSLKVLYR